MKSQRIILKFSGKKRCCCVYIVEIYLLSLHTQHPYLERYTKNYQKIGFVRDFFRAHVFMYLYRLLACLPSSLRTSIDSGVHFKNKKNTQFCSLLAQKFTFFLNRFT